MRRRASLASWTALSCSWVGSWRPVSWNLHPVSRSKSLSTVGKGPLGLAGPKNLSLDSGISTFACISSPIWRGGLGGSATFCPPSTRPLSFPSSFCCSCCTSPQACPSPVMPLLAWGLGVTEGEVEAEPRLVPHTASNRAPRHLNTFSTVPSSWMLLVMGMGSRREGTWMRTLDSADSRLMVMPPFPITAECFLLAKGNSPTQSSISSTKSLMIRYAVKVPEGSPLMTMGDHNDSFGCGGIINFVWLSL
mmetsp:Transcript_26025/g.33655  ORF Transcript_26025/g.33655 Transcript_26025/m.33655 type:complete len:249 (+) Transcript_26025:513-1259(+)